MFWRAGMRGGGNYKPAGKVRKINFFDLLLLSRRFFKFICQLLQILTIFDTCAGSTRYDKSLVKSPTVQRNYSYYVAELYFVLLCITSLTRNQSERKGLIYAWISLYMDGIAIFTQLKIRPVQCLGMPKVRALSLFTLSMAQVKTSESYSILRLL